MSRQIAHKCISIQSFSVLGVLFRQLLCFKNSLGDFKLQFPECYPCDWSLFRFNLSRLGSLISEIRLGGSKSPTGIAQGPSCARAKNTPSYQKDFLSTCSDLEPKNLNFERRFFQNTSRLKCKIIFS